MSISLYDAFNTLNGMHPEDFADRLRSVLKAEKLNQRELARLLDIVPATVTEWLSGRTRSMSAETAFQFEAKLGYSARWLVTGDGQPKMPKVDPTDSIIMEKIAALPNPSKLEVSRFVDFVRNRAAS